MAYNYLNRAGDSTRKLNFIDDLAREAPVFSIRAPLVAKDCCLMYSCGFPLISL